MDTVDWQEIGSVAAAVREWAERMQAELGHWADDLGGMCAVASYELFLALRRRGFDAAFAHNRGHAFVIVDDHVIDITATQFDETEAVLIRRLKAAGHWEVRHRSRSPRQIKQTLRKWPYGQNPFLQKLPRCAA